MMAGRARAAIVIALIVVCSGLAGAAIERYAFARSHRRPAFGPGGPGGGPGRGTREQDAKHRADWLDRLSKDLSLTPVQRSGIDSVMQHTDSLLHSIRVEMQPRLTKVFEESDAAIATRLDSAQRVKFEKRVQARKGRPR